MPKPTLLYIGNMMTKYGKGATILEVLVPLFQQEGYLVFAASDKKNVAFRFTDMIWAVLIYQRKYQYVIIDTFSTFNFYFAFSVSVFLKILQKKYILNLHGGNLKNRLNQRPNLLAWMMKHSYANVAPSAFMVEELKGAKQPIQIIPNPVKLQSFSYLQRNEYQPTLLWFRGFLDLYNPLLTIKIAEQLTSTFEQTKLIMIGPDKGDGTLEQCKEYISKKKLENVVEILGYQTHEQINEVAKKCSLFINCSKVDNTPSALLEAAIMGLPVFTSKAGGIPNMVSEKEVVFFESENPTKMAQQIITAIQNTDQLSVKAENFLKKVDLYKWENIFPIWENILEQ